MSRQALRIVAATLAMLASPIVAAGLDSDPTFILTATAADFPRYFPTYLANGYFSTTTSISGTAATAGYVVGLMDYTQDDVSRPAAAPSWNEVDYFDGERWLNSVPVNSRTFTGYRQTLDMYDGTLTTHYRWDNGKHATSVDVDSFVSQDASHIAVIRVAITPQFTGPVRLTFPLQAWPAPPARFPLGRLNNDAMLQAVRASGQQLKATPPANADRRAIWYAGQVRVDRVGESVDGRSASPSIWLQGRAVEGLRLAEAAAVDVPDTVSPREIRVDQGADRVTLGVALLASKGTTYVFTKYVSLSRDGWGTASETVAAAGAARAAGFDALRTRHAAAWHALWQSDIEVGGDEAVQRAIHSDLFYLLQNTTRDTSWPVMACAFSPGYAGHTFWDSDSWVFPALLLLHPERAKPLVMFRSRTLGPAESRAQEHGYRGAMYPWESDPERGTDQTPAFAWHAPEREIHVNGDIAIAQWQYFLATGDVEWLKTYGWPVIHAIAEFWTSRVTWNGARARYEILHVVSPDEDYTDVPNDTFTNGAARKALSIATLAAERVGVAADPHWDEIASKLYLPFSAAEQRHLDFDETAPHNRRTWMGSDLAWLAYPPLDLPMSAAIRRADFDYQLQALHQQGYDPNSMLTVMLSVEAAELGEADTARSWIGRAMAGYLKPPFNVRSETVLNNVSYLLSPSGGFIQSILYGLSGLRLDEQGLSEVYRPALPTTWRSLTFRNVNLRGRRYDIAILRSAAGEVRLERTPRPRA